MLLLLQVERTLGFRKKMKRFTLTRLDNNQKWEKTESNDTQNVIRWNIYAPSDREKICPFNFFSLLLFFSHTIAIFCLLPL